MSGKRRIPRDPEGPEEFQTSDSKGVTEVRIL